MKISFLLKWSLPLAGWLFLISPALAKPSTSEVEITAMLQVLDSMQELMTGEPEYDREYYQELRSCMATFDPNLVESQDMAWQGYIDYWVMNGTGTDFWGKNTLVYIEQNATVTNLQGMIIYEPCNYASNVAYYHDVTEFCDRMAMGSPFTLPVEYINAFGKSYANLAMGSSFMHGSHTDLGGQQDVRSISFLAYAIHQGALSAIPNCPTILTDLQATPRSQTALEMVDYVMNMHMNVPVEEWSVLTNAMDIPDYYLLFSGIYSTVLTMAFEPDVVDHYVPILCGYFGVSQDIVDFIMNVYLPTLRNVTNGFDLGLVEETRFVENAITGALKMIYAFLWQEEVLTDNPIFLNETVNAIGAEKLPVVNNFLNNINSFDYFEQDFQNGTNIYPGDEWCNPVGPHAKWHLESGIGLLDLTYLGDEMYRLLSEQLSN